MIWFICLEVVLIAGIGYLIFKHQTLISSAMEKTEIQARNLAQKNTFENIKTLLLATGMGRIQSEIWWNHNWIMFKVIFLISILMLVLTQQLVWVMVPAFFVAFKYYALIKNVRLRKYKILKRIPFVLDMLILNLQSGLDFVASLEELIEMNDDHPLHDEIRLTLQSIQVGENRSQAFKNLGIRTQVPELGNVAMVIHQSETMGSSLVELLQLQSQEIRYRIFKQAEAEAQKAPVKILIPLLLCIFPVVFIILFVPIGIQLFANFN